MRVPGLDQSRDDADCDGLSTDDVGFVSGVTYWIATHYTISTTPSPRTALAGFSGGGFLALRMLCEGYTTDVRGHGGGHHWASSPCGIAGSWLPSSNGTCAGENAGDHVQSNAISATAGILVDLVYGQ